MDILDEEVFAVIIAITIVGSAIAIAQILRPEIVEPFNALGVLNEDCRIGEYPEYVYPRENLTLCIFVYNYRQYPALVQVRFKIGENATLPTNTSPSPSQVVKTFSFLIGSKENVTKVVIVPIAIDRSYEGKKIALIFELWIYDIDKKEWIYTGIWNHLYVNVVRVPIP